MTDREPICDFCSQQPVVWRYHVLPLPISMGRDIRGEHVTNSDWGACAICKALVDSGQAEALAQRSLDTHPLRRMLGRSEWRRQKPTVLQAIRGFHTQFFRVKNGPGSPTKIPTEVER